ncbi:PEP/pyruvate-binding domain-containing protein [Stackebrandtia soli]|uniref:PEP/pyruvate-binding domain-containing protein n=1 Tax=Stackebrandtia soli TaxID=1892856 RepID=UPI0039E9A559
MEPTPPPRTVRELSEIDRRALAITGGKGANLGELVAAGAPVPPGFVVTTDAYSAAVRDLDLDLTADPARIREALRRVELDESLIEAIGTAYSTLGGAVAVRSSATAEDLPGAAFAGQHDTVLNVVGLPAVLDAIRRCWASLWTDRAVEYRARLGIDGADVTIAVVVQRMIDSDAAGVMFTIDPVSGDPALTIIDASPGLGESVVAGLVTPDHYVVKRGRVRSFTPGRRERVIRSVSGGGTREARGEADGTPILDAVTVRRLARLGHDIARHFGAPQDIEWCVADETVYIVQSRPITASATPLGRVNPIQRKAAEMFTELTPFRPYPLDVTTWTRESFDGVRALFASMGPRLDPLESLLTEEDGVVVSLTPPTPRVSPLTPFRLLRNVFRSDRYTRDAMLADERLTTAFAIVADGARLDLTALDYDDIDRRLSEALTIMPSIMRLRTRFIPRCAMAALRFGVTLTLLGRLRLFGLLMAGVDHKTAETNRALEELATSIRGDTDLAALVEGTDTADLPQALAGTATGRAFAESLERFLTEYGSRETSILAVSSPTWGDDPGLVLALLKAMASGARPSVETGSARAERELYSHPLLRRGPLRRLVDRQLTAARGFTQFREDTHFYSTLGQPLVRRLLLEYGRRWTEAGALDAPFDVFYLRREELAEPPGAERAAVLRRIVERRRAVYRRLGSAPIVDRRYLKRRRVENALVSGTPGSAGVASGPVRVITDPSQFDRLRPGEVLVAPTTNPAWTPLFGRCAAVVTDTGGAASHAAIVAREYAIPAVLGAVSATTDLAEGTMVTVDGTAGTVTAAN